MIIEIEGIWTTDKGKLYEIRELEVPNHISEMENVGHWILYESDFVNDIDLVCDWAFYDEFFVNYIQRLMDEGNFGSTMNNNVMGTINILFPFLNKYRRAEKIKMILQLLRAFSQVNYNSQMKIFDFVKRLHETKTTDAEEVNDLKPKIK